MYRDDDGSWCIRFWCDLLSESAVLECASAMQQAQLIPPLFCQSPPLADWPNNVSRVLATLPHIHTHTCTFLCMRVRVCIGLSVCVFSTRCLPLTSALHGEWNFPLFVNTWSACLLAVYVQRMYVRDVCDVTNGRCCHNIKICNINKKLSFPTVPAWYIQPDDKQQQGMETQQKPIQQTNRLQFQFVLFLIRQIFLISTAVGDFASPLPKVIRVEVFFISCMYLCICVYFCC